MGFLRAAAVSILFATLAIGTSPGARANDAAGAKSASAQVRFQVHVPRVLRMQIRHQPPTIAVTQADIDQGEVVVRGVRVQVFANDRRGFRLRTEVVHASFAGVTVTGLASAVDVRDGVSITWMPAVSTASAAGPVEVEYRLRLAAGASPGVYAWPVALSLEDA